MRASPILDTFILALDNQSPHWWQDFATQQDWTGTIGAAIDPWRRPMTDTDMREAVGRVKRAVADRLFLAVRAAIEARLVQTPDTSGEASK